MSLIKADRRKKARTTIIGVCGVESGCGVTSLAIALAVMASCGKWRKVILAEVSHGETFSKIRRYYNAKLDSVNETFQLDRIQFITNIDIQQILTLSRMESTFLVLDCGSRIQEYEPFLDLCSRKILLCSLLPWKVQSVEWMLEQGVGHIDWDTILVTTGKKQQTRIRKKTGHRVKAWINIEDPFALSIEAVNELYELACEKKYITRLGLRTLGEANEK